MTRAACANPSCRDGDPRPVDHTWVICRVCTSRLRRTALELPIRHHALERVLARTRPSGQARVSGSSTDPLPVREHVAEVRETIRALLTTWACLITEERNTNGPDNRTIQALGGYVATHSDWLARHPAGGDCVDELTQAHRRASALLDLPRDRAKFSVGPCPEQRCPGQVWAHVAHDPAEPSLLRCPDCEAEWGTASWLRAGAKILARRAQLLARTA